MKWQEMTLCTYDTKIKPNLKPSMGFEPKDGTG